MRKIYSIVKTTEDPSLMMVFKCDVPIFWGYDDDDIESFLEGEKKVVAKKLKQRNI